ncbi:MAG: enoyl-CoA hydratase/isomerase family protein [Actinomycetota bacterium]|nr:enoyl-CoA hydratase/isomerase family protein [Geodermatophilaceae bacterium]MDQ3052352.1 enoyl-CoA hydratase/isomerase family protein [Actinomycetota bacterium]
MSDPQIDAPATVPPTPQALLVDRLDNGVVLLRLNLPDRRNAMSGELTEAWQAAIAELHTERDLRAVVVTGEGKAFCAGGELAWLEESGTMTPDQLRTRMLSFYRAWLGIRTLDVPTIAALNGAAVGAGLAIALACDLRYATPEAGLSMPFTSLGIHPGMASTFLLPEVVGLAVAREMLLTGRVLRGPQALAVGLVNQVFPAESLRAEVLAIASTIATRAPIATRLTRQALADGGHQSFEAALRWEAVAQPLTMATEDLLEGIAAAKGRRTPLFTGR